MPSRTTGAKQAATTMTTTHGAHRSSERVVVVVASGGGAELMAGAGQLVLVLGPAEVSDTFKGGAQAIMAQRAGGVHREDLLVVRPLVVPRAHLEGGRCGHRRAPHGGCGGGYRCGPAA